MWIYNSWYFLSLYVIIRAQHNCPTWGSKVKVIEWKRTYYYKSKKTRCTVAEFTRVTRRRVREEAETEGAEEVASCHVFVKSLQILIAYKYRYKLLLIDIPLFVYTLKIDQWSTHDLFEIVATPEEEVAEAPVWSRWQQRERRGKRHPKRGLNSAQILSMRSF